MDDEVQAMQRKHGLLPPNATALENRLASCTARMEAIEVVTPSLLDAAACPQEFLPWLAWAMGVDGWQDSWHEGVRRDHLADSIRQHKQRGTRASVRHVIRMVLALADKPEREDLQDIKQYDNSFQIKEWWEEDDETTVFKHRRREPHTFDVKLLIGRGVLGSRGILGRELYQSLRHAIDAVKPISTRYSLSIGGAKFEAGCALGHRIRTSQYARFLVTPRIALHFDASLSMGSRVRAAGYAGYLFKPLPKLQFESQLGLQPGLRLVQHQALEFQPPYLKLSSVRSLESRLRNKRYIRLMAKLNETDSKK